MRNTLFITCFTTEIVLCSWAPHLPDKRNLLGARMCRVPFTNKWLAIALSLIQKIVNWKSRIRTYMWLCDASLCRVLVCAPLSSLCIHCEPHAERLNIELHVSTGLCSKRIQRNTKIETKIVWGESRGHIQNSKGCRHAATACMPAESGKTNWSRGGAVKCSRIYLYAINSRSSCFTCVFNLVPLSPHLATTRRLNDK